MDKLLDKNIKQFKLSNGDEIVCEIYQYPDDEFEELIATKIMELRFVDNYMAAIPNRYYALRPWMSFYDNVNLLYSLNPMHIVGEVTPSVDLKKLYFKSLSILEKQIKEGDNHRLVVRSDSLEDEGKEDEEERLMEEMYREGLEGRGEDEFDFELELDNPDDSSAPEDNIIKFKLDKKLR
jgi:hypothetical protein